jgi:protein-S-isoprenylcysteine O-methyltransferase Ste14
MCLRAYIAIGLNIQLNKWQDLLRTRVTGRIYTEYKKKKGRLLPRLID